MERLFLTDTVQKNLWVSSESYRESSGRVFGMEVIHSHSLLGKDHREEMGGGGEPCLR